MRKNIKNKKGFSLSEIVISLSLFIVLVGILTALFQSVFASQRRVAAGLETQENLRYIFELMSRQIRTAQKDEGGECWPETKEKVFYVPATNDEIFFKDSQGACLNYYLSSDTSGTNRLTLGLREDPLDAEETAYLSPENVEITDLTFLVKNGDSSTQPLSLLRIKAETKTKTDEKEFFNIQTAISSRHYEN